MLMHPVYICKVRMLNVREASPKWIDTLRALRSLTNRSMSQRWLDRNFEMEEAREGEADLVEAERMHQIRPGFYNLYHFYVDLHEVGNDGTERGFSCCCVQR